MKRVVTIAVAALAFASNAAAARENSPTPFDDRGPAFEGGPALPVAASGEPRIIYLFYADGQPAPPPPPPAIPLCNETPPPFLCKWGGAEGNFGCKKQIQAYLDRWYRDFNVVFTLTRPAAGPYYTEVITTGGGDWCGKGSEILGNAPSSCADQNGGVAYTFVCASAQVCAQTIAQEQAHLVGLDHTNSQRDLLYPTAPCESCDQFEDDDANQTVGSTCAGRTLQNSYKMMRDRLGAWPGGFKPGLCQDDSKEPSVLILAPRAEPGSSRVTLASESLELVVAAMDDCGIAEVYVRLGNGEEFVSDLESDGFFHTRLGGISGTVEVAAVARDISGKSASSPSLTLEAPKAHTRERPGIGPGCASGGGSPGSLGVVLGAAVFARIRLRRKVMRWALPRRWPAPPE